MSPIFLWSTVTNQLHQPVIAVGRRRTPLPLVGTVTLAIYAAPIISS